MAAIQTPHIYVRWTHVFPNKYGRCAVQYPRYDIGQWYVGAGRPNGHIHTPQIQHYLNYRANSIKYLPKFFNILIPLF